MPGRTLQRSRPGLRSHALLLRPNLDPMSGARVCSSTQAPGRPQEDVTTWRIGLIGFSANGLNERLEFSAVSGLVAPLTIKVLSAL
jgi:hypothetical protein